MPAPALLLYLLMTGAPPLEAGTPRLLLRDELLRVGDLAHAPAAEAMIVARLPESLQRIELSEAQRISLLRRRLPGARLALRHKGTLLVVRAHPAHSSAAARTGCFVARADIPEGHRLNRQDVAEAPCGAGGAERRLRYDVAARAPFARAAIPSGSHLGKLRLPDEAPVAAGQPLALRTVVGPVTIERTVTAIQAGRRGKRLFVRTGDGKLIAAKLSGAGRGGAQ